MTIIHQPVRYEVDGRAFESLAVWEDAGAGPRPGVLVAPTFMGRSACEEGKAEALARLGHVGVAIDIYGADVRPTSMEDARTAMSALNENRPAIARRMTAALDAVRALDGVDAAKVAAVGFCFGGKCVLDLVRSGAEFAGAVTFHGIFDQPPQPAAERYHPRLLILHGWADPVAKPGAVLQLADELTERAASWELVAYGHTVHGFTNPGRPTAYSEEADRRSWDRMARFLDEVLA